MTLEIGIANDENFQVIEETYWKSYCSMCTSPQNNRYGCGHWVTVRRQIRGITGDRLRLYASGGVYVEGNLYYTSSGEYKENIKKLCPSTVQDALDGLEPVEFNFKGDHDRTTIGFIAENVSDIFAAHDKKAINPMEIIAVLVNEVKEQENAIKQLKKKVTTLKNRRVNS